MVNNNLLQINVIYRLKALLERLYYHVMIKVMDCMESNISCPRMPIEILVDTSSQIQLIKTCMYCNVYCDLDQSIVVLN